MIRLRRWGGLVAVDLIGTGLDGDAVMTAARHAFGGDPDVVFGPVNRFGVLQLAHAFEHATRVGERRPPMICE